MFTQIRSAWIWHEALHQPVDRPMAAVVSLLTVSMLGLLYTLAVPNMEMENPP